MEGTVGVGAPALSDAHAHRERNAQPDDRPHSEHPDHDQGEEAGRAPPDDDVLCQRGVLQGRVRNLLLLGSDEPVEQADRQAGQKE